MSDKTTLSVLIANDDDAQLHHHASIVYGCKHRVVGLVKNGRELLEAAQSLKPDVVLSDLNMPLMNGLDACYTIKKKYPDIKCIITSVFSELSGYFKISNKGLDGFLFAPLTAHKLQLCMQRIASGNMYVDLTYRKDFIAHVKQIKNEIRELTEPTVLNLESAIYDVVLHNGKQIKINDRHILLVSAIYHRLERSQLAAWLNISEQSVDTTIKRLKQNLDMEDRVQLVRLFESWGYIR